MNKPKLLSLIKEVNRPLLLERIRNNLIDDNGCFIWKNKKLSKKGYAQVYAYGHTWQLHRLHYMLLNGEIADGYEVDHLCKNRACANPSHLEAVPSLINWQRSSAPSVGYATATHCKRGHVFTEDNTLIRKYKKGNTGRECKTCKKDNIDRWHENKVRKIYYDVYIEIESLKAENEKLRAAARGLFHPSDNMINHLANEACRKFMEVSETKFITGYEKGFREAISVLFKQYREANK